MIHPHTRRKLEKLEKKKTNAHWRHFGLTRNGRMSWADWFPIWEMPRLFIKINPKE